MHARRLAWLFAAVSLVTCAAEREDEELESMPGHVVHGELPAGISIEDIEIPPGSFGVVGDPSTGQMATIVPTSADDPALASGHFSVTSPATCIGCDGKCDSLSREIAIGLTQDKGPDATPLRVQEHSSMNFGSPEHSPSSWISEVGSTVNISTLGTLSACATFSYYFDIAECGPEDDCVCAEGTSDCDGNPGCELDHTLSPNTCATASYVGEHCGDVNCGFVCPPSNWELFATRTGDSTQWFRARARECSTCSANITARVQLQVPDGIDYDLRVYSQCGTLWATSTNGPGENELVTLTIPDWADVDDSFDYWVEVQYKSGSSCEPWTLQYQGRNCS